MTKRSTVYGDVQHAVEKVGGTPGRLEVIDPVDTREHRRVGDLPGVHLLQQVG